MRTKYIKFFEDSLQDFIRNNIRTGFAFKKKGRWGTYHWEIATEKGDYQKRINTDTEEEALIQYYNKYLK